MKRVLLSVLLFPVLAISQETTMIGDTLVTKSGFKIYKNQELKIGTGAMQDGDFKFIRRSSTSLFTYYSNTGYQGLANQANALPRNQSGHKLTVIRIDKRGSKKSGYVYYPIIETGLLRYEVDIDPAIASGEIDVPDEFKPKKESQTVVVKQEASLADELSKLKKLLDDGVLSKEEFDAAKKKLLDKQ